MAEQFEERDDIENARRHMLRCAMSWGEIIVVGRAGEPAYAALRPTYHPTEQAIDTIR
jgi:hypothetical protein